MSDTERRDDIRRLRHDLRGAFNELRLCVEVLQLETDEAQVLAWLARVERAAGRCDAAVLRLEACSPDASGGGGVPPS